MENKNWIVIKSCTDKAVDEFLKLCDIAHKLRIKSSNDGKKYLTDNHIPLSKIKLINERKYEFKLIFRLLGCLKYEEYIRAREENPGLVQSVLSRDLSIQW